MTKDYLLDKVCDKFIQLFALKFLVIFKMSKFHTLLKTHTKVNNKCIILGKKYVIKNNIEKITKKAFGEFYKLNKIKLFYEDRLRNMSFLIYQWIKKRIFDKKSF